MLNLGEIAKLIGAECHGDSNITVDSVADIFKAGSRQLSFITNIKYVKDPHSYKASGIITSAEIAAELFTSELLPILAAFLLPPQ